jgi:hypothetical protein
MNDENEQTLQPHTEPLELPFDPAEMETLRAENERLRVEARTRLARDTLVLALGQAGAREPELMFRAVRADLQFGDDGSLTNAAALVGRLRREFPEAFGARSASIDGGAGVRSSQFLTKEMLRKMSPGEIAKLDWADVRRVLSE